MHEVIEKYYRACVLASLMVLLFISSPVIGAERDFSTAGQRLQTPITYTCTEKPIEQVLMELAEQAQVDIVKSPRVTGNVTVKVTNVPLEEALDNILAAHGYTYIATENMVRVIPLPEIAAVRELFVTRIYQITYADANEVAAALRKFVSGQGKVALNKGTSHIMVMDTESKIKSIDKFIERIDHITPQVVVEVRIYDITSSENFELGSDWHVARNAPLTADAIILPDEVTITEFAEDRTDERKGIERGDTDNYTDKRDEDSTTTESTFLNPPPIMTNFRRKPFVGGSFDRIDGGTLSFSLLNDAVDIDFALSVLHKQVEAKLLANPRVLVLDNETANFEIIREIPYRELRQVAREDPITYTEFKNVGVHLKVTPHIARDGMIKLHIEPEFGALVGLDAQGVPTIDTRRADTVAMIKDGQTIAIGGLRKKETSKDVTSVPVLGDMPIIGGLFRSETESVVTSELVVFITTRIITRPALSAVERRQFDATEFFGPEMMKIEIDQPDITEKLDRLLEKL